MDDVFKTIAGTSEGVYKEKGSKFLAFAYSVNTEEDVRKLLTEIREKYYDARHHCYAYMLGSDKKTFRFNDDGEPSSTAGKPILGQIYSKDITNVLIIVVRYFGGTKLGVSGLIHAYREAAADALANADIVEKTLNTVFRISFNYALLNDVMRIIKEEAPDVLDRNFENECRMTLSIRKSNADKLYDRLTKVEGLKIDIEN
ncbi:MAG: YigZ family protein [Culturomica sp.]|jgi:uncharacterized YigZ family protein|nr:YigZ family protein [Culturomica sp.]